MKILTVLENNSWITHHISGSLCDMGHEVWQFNYGDAVGEFYGRNRRQDRNRKNQDLLKVAGDLVRDKGLDLIFCYVYDDFLQEDTAAKLRQLNIPMLNYNVDMVNQWYRQIRTAKYFTYMLCAQKINMENMASYGGNVLYFPMAGRISDRSDSTNSFIPEQPVTFMGTPMPYRNHVLKKLIDKDVPLAIYGKFWNENKVATADRSVEKTVSDICHYGLARYKSEGAAGLLTPLTNRLFKQSFPSSAEIPKKVLCGFLDQSDIENLFKYSKINLGFSRMMGDDPDKPGVNQVKLRDFEVPLSGGFYLAEKAPDYDELFEIGSEVETWSTHDELLEKINYYLDHEEERKKVAKAGHERAIKYHTWEVRFKALFDKLKIA